MVLETALRPVSDMPLVHLGDLRQQWGRLKPKDLPDGSHTSATQVPLTGLRQGVDDAGHEPHLFPPKNCLEGLASSRLSDEPLG